MLERFVRMLIDMVVGILRTVFGVAMIWFTVFVIISILRLANGVPFSRMLDGSWSMHP